MHHNPHENADTLTRTRKQVRAWSAWIAHVLPRLERADAEREARAARLRESMGDVKMPANASDAHRAKDAAPTKRRATPTATADGQATGDVVVYRTNLHAGEWRVQMSQDKATTRATPLTDAERRAKAEAAKADAIRERVAVLDAHVADVQSRYVTALTGTRESGFKSEPWVWRTPVIDERQGIIRTMREMLAQRDSILADWQDATLALVDEDVKAKAESVVAHRTAKSAYRASRRRAIAAAESAEDRATRLAKQREQKRLSRERAKAATA